MKTNNKSYGFTLIELLVVIAILGILASLLLVAIPRVMRRADTIKCASNLRQIGLSVFMYANDHNGKLPGPAYLAVNRTTNVTRNMIRKMMPYVPLIEEGKICTLPICPTADDFYEGDVNAVHYRRIVSVPDFSGDTFDPFGYAVGSRPLTLNVVFLRSSLSAPDIPMIYDNDQMVRAASNGPPEPIHDGARNILFMDGHVELVYGEDPFKDEGLSLR